MVSAKTLEIFLPCPYGYIIITTMSMNMTRCCSGVYIFFVRGCADISSWYSKIEVSLEPNSTSVVFLRTYPLWFFVGPQLWSFWNILEWALWVAKNNSVKGSVHGRGGRELRKNIHLHQALQNMTRVKNIFSFFVDGPCVSLYIHP